MARRPRPEPKTIEELARVIAEGDHEDYMRLMGQSRHATPADIAVARAKKGKPRPPHVAEMLRNYWKGRKRSEINLAKKSIALRKKKLDEYATRTLGGTTPKVLSEVVARADRAKHRGPTSEKARALWAAMSEADKKARYAKSSHRKRLVREQWGRDVEAAFDMGHEELLRDVRRSKGLLVLRRVFDSTGVVSHGFYDGEVRWSFDGLRPQSRIPAENRYPDSPFIPKAPWKNGKPRKVAKGLKGLNEDGRIVELPRTPRAPKPPVEKPTDPATATSTIELRPVKKRCRVCSKQSRTKLALPKGMRWTCSACEKNPAFFCETCVGAIDERSRVRISSGT